MLKDAIQYQLAEALKKAAPNLNNLLVEESVLDHLKIERPRNQEHGDYAVNVSPLARFTKMPPPKIAENIAECFQHADMDTQTIAGFINFKISPGLLGELLLKILQSPKPGKNASLKDQRILLEYVSANPTGPLHIGHGRWAALGDSLVRLFRHAGATVTPEFYINDAGVQMKNLGISLWWRSLELLKNELPNLKYEAPETLPYPGEYVVDLAQAYLAVPERKATLMDIIGEFEQGLDYDINPLIVFAKNHVLEQQQKLLSRIGVEFEAWFSEKEYLHDRNMIEKALEKLKANGHTYEEEGALWFRSSTFGDDKDRVLIKSDSLYTYLAADIAYHDHKFSRVDDNGNPQYNRYINIWGADHHGYIPRMRGAIEALGHDPNEFEVLLGQLVNLIIDGEKTRMGKRRKMLTLEDVVEEVGVDATRFWMVSKSADTALDFDVALAMSATQENPVFYAQYAHARCCSILRNAVESSPNVDTGETVNASFTADELENLEAKASNASLAPLFKDLDEQVREALKTLILRLDSFEDLIIDAAKLRAPHMIARYTLDLAADFHSFYNVCRILTPDREVTQARLMLIKALQKTLKQALHLLGVSAPESM